MTISVTHSTAPDDSFSTEGAAAWSAGHVVTGLGTMATQDANNVAITGGSISGVTVSGVVTSVSGTAPIASSGGTTPAISITQSGSASNGYLSSTDWNTFNNKVSMVYPGAGIPNSTGSAWGTSYTTTGTGTVVALATGPTLSGPTIDGANPYIQFNNGVAVTLAAGRMWYNGTTGSLNFGMGGGNITQQIGEELFIYGKASAAITEGELIVKTGVVGASGVITFGPSPTGLTVNDGIIGVATENIASGNFGRITTFGIIHGIDTTGSSVGETWVNNDTLYYNPFYAGGMTNVKPSAPNIKFQIATVINAGPSGSGSIQVDLYPGSTLGGTDSNVQFTTPTGGQLLSYDETDGYWKNTSLSAGSGISVTPAANGGITIANTSPSSGGTVTSVTGTAPVNVATGTTTPVISMAAASGSVNGYLTSTDWTTFNSKQPAGNYLTAVTVDSPLTGSGTSASHLSIPAASGSVNGYLTSTDWTTFNSKTSNTGTVTSVGGTGSVSGITLSGTVTTSGNLTLGGSLDLSSPPAIGGTSANTINGSTITGTKFVGIGGGTF